MARIQYQPASRDRGFKPQQLSTAGINRMREDSSRLLQGLEAVRREELAQRERVSQAMKANDAYTKEAEARNYEIQIQNLKVENDFRNKQIQLEQAEAQAKQAQTSAILNTIKGLSQTASQVANFIDTAQQQYKKEQTEIGTQKGQDAPEIKLQETERLEGIRNVGTIQQSTNINIDAALSGASEDERLANHVANPGAQSYAHQAFGTAVTKKQYKTLYKDPNDQDLYLAPNGEEFTVSQIGSDLDRLKAYNEQHKQKFLDALGGGDETYYRDAVNHIDLIHAAEYERTKSRREVENRELLLQRADTMALNDDTTSYMLARDSVKNAVGQAKANDWVFKKLEDPTTNADAILAMRLRGSEKTFGEEYPKRVAYHLGRRSDNERKQALTEFSNQTKDFEIAINGRLEDILEDMNEDPYETMRSLETFRDEYFPGLPLPNIVKNIERDAIAKSSEKIRAVVEEKANNYMLTRDFINRLPMRERAAAIKRYEQQQVELLGPNYENFEVEKGIKGEAEKLVSASPSGEKTLIYGVVKAEIKNRYIEFYRATGDELIAIDKVREEVNAAVNGDASSFFYASFDKYNDPEFSFATPSEESIERSQNINQKMNALGAEARKLILEPGVLATQREMDEYHRSGKMPAGLIQYANATGASITESFNKYQTVMNESKGTNKPLITMNEAVAKLLDTAAATDTELYRELSADQAAKIRRGSVRMGITQPSFRFSAGVYTSGGNYNAPERALIDTIFSSEGADFNTVYGGAQVPQLTEMTLGELYDAIKLGGTDAIPERLGGGKIPFKRDQYNSSASGAPQLMPETLRGLVESGRYSWDQKYSPQTQIQITFTLAREANVDPSKPLTLEDMRKLGSIWASLTPQYGQTGTTAEQSLEKYNQILNKYR